MDSLKEKCVVCINFYNRNYNPFYDKWTVGRSFHQVWIIFGHYFFKYFFCSLPSLCVSSCRWGALAFVLCCTPPNVSIAAACHILRCLHSSPCLLCAAWIPMSGQWEWFDLDPLQPVLENMFQAHPHVCVLPWASPSPALWVSGETAFRNIIQMVWISIVLDEAMVLGHSSE